MCSRMSVSPTPTCVRCAMHSPDPRTQRDDQPRLIYLHAIYLVAQHPRNTPVFWHSPPAIRAGGIVVQGASSFHCPFVAALEHLAIHGLDAPGRAQPAHCLLRRFILLMGCLSLSTLCFPWCWPVSALLAPFVGCPRANVLTHVLTCLPPPR